MSLTKLKLLICVTPIYGHVAPLIAIAKALIGRGYDVTMLTGSDFKAEIEASGASFTPLEGYADITEAKLAALVKKVLGSSPPPSWDEVMADSFIGWVAGQHEGVQRALRAMCDNMSESSNGNASQIMILFEGSFRGTLPTLLGAPGIKPIGHIGIGVIPIIGLSSIDTAPLDRGLKVDTSPEGRLRNKAANEKYLEQYTKSEALWKDTLKNIGARDPGMHWRETTFRLPNRFIQMCAPSMEYPRSDAPSTLVFSGGLGPGLRNPMKSYPDWWGDIAVNASRKKIVAVSQGTLTIDPTDLIIPTMMSLKDRDDIIVVAALGKKGAKLAEDVVVPINTRYADYIPYDDILQYSDVFVTNGGYGSLQHALGNGVPLVVGGISADKAENALIVEWTGVGINLHTDRPSVEAVYQAVVESLENPKYKKRAKEIQLEMKSYDPVGVIVENIEKVAAEAA